MNYRNVYRALSIKNAYLVLKDIYDGCLVCEYRSFDTLKNNLRINKATLRRITNRLSNCGLINSIKDSSITDGRKRVYVITDSELMEKISELTQYIAR